jgi:predicted 3-demethylubiquinone-9 3-methyltransferase (glyoxalase superfamily)
MPTAGQKITPCLWFDSQAEEAANFYVSIFKNSRIGRVSRYGKEGFEIHGRPAGSVMTVEFQLEGQTYVALNGGPHFKFNEAISLQVHCETQAEVDDYWRKLGQEGPCGWLKDKYGLSWQVADRADGDADGRRPREGATGHQGVPADEEVRHRGAEAGVPGTTLSEGLFTSLVARTVAQTTAAGPWGRGELQTGRCRIANIGARRMSRRRPRTGRYFFHPQLRADKAVT